MSASVLEEEYEPSLLSIRSHASRRGAMHVAQVSTGTVEGASTPVDTAFVTEIKGEREQADARYLLFVTSAMASESERQDPLLTAEALPDTAALTSVARVYEGAISPLQDVLTLQRAATLGPADELLDELTRATHAANCFSLLWQEKQRATREHLAEFVRRLDEFAAQVKLPSVTTSSLADALTTFIPSGAAVAELAEREIRQLLEEGRVRRAREVLGNALSLAPESASLKGWQKVLARPRVRRVKGARARSRRLECEWLKRHAREYEGQWVALSGDKLVAAGPKLAEVLTQARSVGQAAEALFHFIPARRP